MKSKVTYQIDDQVLQALRAVVDEGAARTMSEFVQEAISERLSRLRREEIRRRIEAAAADPLFVEDVRETTQAYESTDAEGLGHPMDRL
jgi:Arc/MetJ-type ribon-helix-helix transcriptional regulator